MHFIDYLPLPIYILIAVFSLVGIFKYLVFNKKLNLLERIGYYFMVPMVFSLIIIKLVEKTSFYFEYYHFLWIFILIGLGPGFITAIIGAYKRIDNPQKKKQILIGLILMYVPLSLFGLVFLYLWIIEG